MSLSQIDPGEESDKSSEAGYISAAVALPQQIGADILQPLAKPNAWIDRSSTGSLLVVKWDDPSPTMNTLMITHGSDFSLDMSADVGIGSMTTTAKPTMYRVTWEPNEGDSPKRTSEREMRISVKPGRAYLIRVSAIFYNKEGPPSETLKFRSAPQRPTSIKIDQDNDDSVVVEFEDPDEEPKKYLILHRNVETNDCEMSSETEGKSCILKNLIPGARYRISVQAVDIHGEFNFKSAKKSVEFTLRPSSPQNLRCDRHMDGYMLSWDKVDKAEKYLLAWASCSDDNKLKTVAATSHYFTTAELLHGRTYEFSVCATSSLKRLSNPGVLIFDTDPRVPSNIRVNVDGYSAHVHFQDDYKSENTYRITARSVNGGEDVEVQTQFQFAALHLEPAGCYTIDVCAINGGRTSPKARYSELVQTGRIGENTCFVDYWFDL